MKRTNSARGAKIKWTKIKWSENLNEAKFEKSKVDSLSVPPLQFMIHGVWKCLIFLQCLTDYISLVFVWPVEQRIDVHVSAWRAMRVQNS